MAQGRFAAVVEMELIYCAGGNRRFAEIARDAGFQYGAQLPDTIYFPLYFADQDWRKPDRTAYMEALARHRPHMAAVLDLERGEQLSETLSWAEEAAQYVEQVIVIPKVCGIISEIPAVIEGKQVVLGYSVPTSYGATFVPIWEFAGWPVHLLGGSPQRQIQLWRYFSAVAEVVSSDGNMILGMAVKRCQFWSGKRILGARDKRWPQLREVGPKYEVDAPYEAFRRSCVNIRQAWDELLR
jgi:hypothetical protein